MFPQILIVTLIVAVLTALERFAPFLLFSRGKTPPIVRYLGRVLPPAMIAALVIYCYKTTTFSSLSAFAPQLIAGGITVLLHLWKKSTVLSVAGGTAAYMLLIRTLFAA